MITAFDLANLGIDPEEYNNLSEAEKQSVNDILQEMAQGNNNQYNELFYADYEEIPVDFITFVNDPQYVGKSTKNGTAIYDFWKKEGARIVNGDEVEVALSGSIGTGKSLAASLMISYLLYKLMCLRDPQGFFDLKPGSKICVALLNNTLASSYGVGFDSLQSFLMESPWFLKHGTVVGRTDETRHYVPSKGFEIIVGSRIQHTLGRAIALCLTGDTEVLTSEGLLRLDELVGRDDIKVYSYKDRQVLLSDPCSVVLTKYVDELVSVELEDGTIIKCTPEHRFLLKSGEYKEAQYLTEDDELEDINLGSTD